MAALELDLLVGMGVVVVVLDSPGLKGVDEGHEGKGANNILHQLVLAEGSVSTVMANDEPLQPQWCKMSCQASTAINVTGEDAPNMSRLTELMWHSVAWQGPAAAVAVTCANEAKEIAPT